MAYSSSKAINDIATQYVQNVGSGSDVQYGVAGITSDLEMAQLNNAWNAEQVQKQMDYETQMSNTAHQREVKDLIKAGLNPVLSAKLAGASTPQVTAASADTGATGSGSHTSQNAIQAKVARENALVQAQAQITAASISASAQQYAADMAYQTAVLNNENPNSWAGLLRELIEGITGDSVSGSSSSAKGLVVDGAKKLFNLPDDSQNSRGKGSSSSSPAGSPPSTYTFMKGRSSSNSFTQTTSLSKGKMTSSSISSWNSSHKSSVNTSAPYIRYSDFFSYADYVSFCNTFNLKGISESDFNSHKLSRTRIFQ